MSDNIQQPDLLSKVALQNLAALHKRVYVDCLHADTHDYQLALSTATVAIRPSTPADTVLTLAGYWFDYFRLMVLHDKPVSTGLLYKAELIRDNLVGHNLIRTLAGSESDGNIMTWLGLIRIAEIENMDWSLDETDVDLLTQWWGQSYTPGTRPTLQEAVTVVYGPGVWDLYATDMKFIADVPSHLYRLGLPATCPASRVQFRDSAPSSIALPNDTLI